MKKYTYKEFLEGEFSILVSEDTIKRTLEQLSKTELKWHSGENLNEFISTYHGYMCLVVENGSLGWKTVLSNWTPLVTMEQLTMEEVDIKPNDFIGQCVKSENEQLYTVGKLYYFKNSTTVNNKKRSSYFYDSIEDFNKRNFHYKMVEIKEVKRKAKVGEFVKIVRPFQTPETNGVLDYDKGSILKIISIDDNGNCRYSYKYDSILCESEYVVLEGYQDIKIDKIEVGDMVEYCVDIGTIVYNRFSRFFKETHNEEYESHYVIGKCPQNHEEYKIVAIGKPKYIKNKIYCIQDLNTTQVFLVGRKGIKKC